VLGEVNEELLTAATINAAEAAGLADEERYYHLKNAE